MLLHQWVIRETPSQTSRKCNRFILRKTFGRLWIWHYIFVGGSIEARGTSIKQAPGKSGAKPDGKRRYLQNSTLYPSGIRSQGYRLTVFEELHGCKQRQFWFVNIRHPDTSDNFPIGWVGHPQPQTPTYQPTRSPLSDLHILYLIPKPSIRARPYISCLLGGCMYAQSMLSISFSHLIMTSSHTKQHKRPNRYRKALGWIDSSRASSFHDTCQTSHNALTVSLWHSDVRPSFLSCSISRTFCWSIGMSEDMGS